MNIKGFAELCFSKVPNFVGFFAVLHAELWVCSLNQNGHGEVKEGQCSVVLVLL